MTKTREEYYTVTTMKISTRLLAYIFNAVIVCFCALTIASYFFAPAMNYGAKVVTTPELTEELKKLLITEDSSSTEKEAGEISENEVIADVLDQLGKDKVTLTFSIKATTPQLFALLFNKAETEAAIKRVINANVSTVLDEMSGSIDVVVEDLSKSMLRLSVKSALSDTINDFISNEESSDKTVDTVLNDLGLTDEYLDKKSGRIFEAIKADGATVDTVTDATIAVIDEVVNELASSTTGEYENLTIENLPDSVKETIKSSIKSIIGGFADKNGNINPDSIIYNVLGRALDKSSDITPTEGEETAAIKTALFADGEKTYTKEDVGNAFETLDQAPDLMYDFCANCCEYAITEVLRHAGPKHVMYGTDMPILRMRTRRIEENGTYINLVPPGLYGDPKQAKHLREVSAEEAEKITFFLYEELLAFKRAAKTLGLSRQDIEDIMYNNAHDLIEGARKSIYG